MNKYKFSGNFWQIMLQFFLFNFFCEQRYCRGSTILRIQFWPVFQCKYPPSSGAQNTAGGVRPSGWKRCDVSLHFADRPPFLYAVMFYGFFMASFLTSKTGKCRVYNWQRGIKFRSFDSWKKWRLQKRNMTSYYCLSFKNWIHCQLYM